jgi:membrane protease YdiL (CAAX protease family)
MFRVETLTNNSSLRIPDNSLEQTNSLESFWQKTANFANKTFNTLSRNFLKGALIKAVILAPLEGLMNLALKIKDETTLLDTFRKISRLSGISLLSSPFVVYGIGIVLLPIAEELIFRLGIQNGIKKASKYLLSKNVSLQKEGKDEIYASKISRIAGSIIFGLSHLDPIEASIIGVSSYFTESKAYEKDGLAGSIGMHMGHNAVCGVLDCITILRRRFFPI